MSQLYNVAALVLATGIAAWAHWRVAHYGQACFVAATISVFPSLLVMEVAGAARTDFVVFTVFVLFSLCLAVSAISGLPYLISRSRRGQAMDKIAFTNRLPGPFVGGAVVASLLIALPILLRLEDPVLGLVITAIVSALGGAVTGALFQASMRLHHFPGGLSARQLFVAGAGITLCLVLTIFLIVQFVPDAINAPHDHLKLAMALNALFFVPAVAGVVVSRGVVAPPAPTRPSSPTSS